MSPSANDVKSLFGRALEFADPAERARFLDRACEQNVALRVEVEGLLDAMDRAGGFLKQVPVANDGAKSPATATFGTEVPVLTTDYPGKNEYAGAVIADKYTLVEPIGEGGMGSVWRAKQTEPVKRFVAVKLIKAGMDSKQVLARFEAERQALALMDHPNIAKVLDGGVIASPTVAIASPAVATAGLLGRPYFVMELVKGIPITEYCDAHKLTPQHRLELFVQVCQAIQHAHQKGIIHRDIKPSNVLIALYDDKPVVKVIDFGVAKATGAALTEKTFDTGFGAVVGTPEYMSPEQATFNNLDIDTRSDVYALGVLLYELLAGSTPFSNAELKRKGLLEILRIVREEEPPRPSTKLSTADALPSISANRGTEPKKLTGLLRNELDWIVMKALEKDRTRRYETANGFAADVLRYLGGEAVQAHPPSTVYRLRKAYHRNRMAATMATVLMLSLVAGIATSLWQAVRANDAEHTTRAESARAFQAEEQALRNEAAAREQEKQASRKANEAQALVRFIDNLIREGDEQVQDESKFRDKSFYEVLIAAESKIEWELRDYPTAEAQIRTLLGDLFRERNDKRAIQQYQIALKLRRQELGPEHAETLKVLFALADVYEYLEKWEDGLATREECLDQQMRLHGPSHPNTLDQRIRFASLCFHAKQPDRASAAFETIARDIMAMVARAGVLELKLVEIFMQMGDAYQMIGEREKAVHWYHEAGRAFGPAHERFATDEVQAANFMTGLAEHFARAAQLPDALHWYERYIQVLNTGVIRENDETMHQRWTANRHNGSGWFQTDESPFWAWLDCDTLIAACHRPQDLERLSLLLANHLHYVRKSWPEARVALAKTLSGLGLCRVKQGRCAAAESPLRESLELYRKESPNAPTTYQCLSNLVESLVGQQKYDEAEPLLCEWLAIREKTKPNAWTTFNIQSRLGGALLGQKKYADAEPLLLKGYEGMKQREKTIPPQGNTRIPEALDRLIELYTATNKPDDVKKWRAERAKYPPELAPPPRSK